MPGWRYTTLFLCGWLLLLLLPAAVVVAIDPYQVFHRSLLPKVYFYKENERYQVPGLIKHYLGTATGTDSLVIGTSLSTNFLEDDIQAKLGWPALNLSMRGSSLAERSVAMEQAIATGRVRRILFEINPIDFREELDNPYTDPTFPAYLYSPGVLDKGRYLFNQTVLAQALALYLQSYPLPGQVAAALPWPVWNPGAWHEGLRHWIAWMETAEPTEAFREYNAPANRAMLERQLAEAHLARQQAPTPWRQDYPFASVKTYLVDAVRRHPEVEFHIWFPPVSPLRYALESGTGITNTIVELRRFLVHELAQEPNVKLYGLDGELAVTGKLSNYMDAQHFSMPVQQWVLDSIGQDRYRLTPANIDSYAATLRDNILQFALSPVEAAGAVPDGQPQSGQLPSGQPQ